MTFLLGSLALLAGPFLFSLGARYAGTRQALDGFILVTLAGIVCLHIVPESWRVAGALSILFLALGLAFPLLLESVFSRALERAHLAVVIIAALGIGIHALLDGIALIPVGDEAGLFANKLALGVIIHRLPVGMAIWWSLRPQFGNAAVLAVLMVVIGVTGLSYYLGADVIGAADSTSLAVFQSFIAGSLVHVALFGRSHHHGAEPGHEHGDDGRSASWPFRVGLLLGLVTVFLLPHVHVD